MSNSLFSYVGSCAERSQVGTHQARKIQDNTAYCERKGDPAISGNILRLRPFRSYLNQITGRQPDADVGSHAQKHGYCR